MYKLNKIKSMFNCKLCSKLLVDPVTISCGQIVCRYHVNTEFECQFCGYKHSEPNDGFAINSFIQDLLKMKLNSIDLNPIFEACRNRNRRGQAKLC